MRDDFDLTSPTYTPQKLLSAALVALKARSHNELARKLEMHPSTLTRIHKREAAVSDRVMIDIADRTEWSVKHIRELAGMPFEGATLPSQDAPGKLRTKAGNGQRLIQYSGKDYTRAQLSTHLGVNYFTLCMRISRGLKLDAPVTKGSRRSAKNPSKLNIQNVASTGVSA